MNTKAVGALIVAFFLILSFQNCSQTGFKNQLIEKQDLSSQIGNQSENDQSGNQNDQPEDSNSNSNDNNVFVPPVDQSQLVTNVKYYWIAADGNNSNDCLSEANACRSIQKAINIAMPGETILIKAGTYIEDSASSEFTNKCYWISPSYGSLCLKRSGTLTSPITIKAAPGHEGLAVINNENVRIGINFQSYDYIHIKGLKLINNRNGGVASWGQAQNPVPNEAALSVGCVIENNIFLNTTGAQGGNVSAIAMWGSRSWIVRDNLIDGVSAEGTTAAAGIQSYGVINALIENNVIRNADFGIFWKDHFINNESTRTNDFESEIRYNKIYSISNGIMIGIRGALTVEAGENYIHHNIIVAGGTGIFGNMNGAYELSDKIRIENNIIDGVSNDEGGIYLSGFKSAVLKGNIIVRTSVDFQVIHSDNVKLDYSNFNILDTSLQILMDRYSSTGVTTKYFTSLTSWKNATTSSAITLGVNNPDTNSIQASVGEIFVNADAYNYNYIANSKALNFMSDGSHAGPYQYGTETIGLINNK